MQLRIHHCQYDLVKDILWSLDSLVINVEKQGCDVIVTTYDRKSRNALLKILKQDIFFQLLKETLIDLI